MKNQEAIAATNAVDPKAKIEIKGIDCPTIARYFETLNASEFTATSELFALNGQLKPPFEEPIAGSTAIAQYLEAEASGMKLFPRQGKSEIDEEGNTEFEIIGLVETSFFTVNVAWQFVLNPEAEILFVRVKLLASLQELVKMRSE